MQNGTVLHCKTLKLFILHPRRWTFLFQLPWSPPLFIQYVKNKENPTTNLYDWCTFLPWFLVLLITTKYAPSMVVSINNMATAVSRREAYVGEKHKCLRQGIYTWQKKIFDRNKAIFIKTPTRKYVTGWSHIVAVHWHNFHISWFIRSACNFQVNEIIDLLIQLIYRN